MDSRYIPTPPKHKSQPRIIWAQLAVLGFVAAVITTIIITTYNNLSARGITIGFEFLYEGAGFSISESFIPYLPENTNLWAIAVGIGNTLGLSAMIIVASTILGTFLGIARLGTNPLTSSLSKLWIESFRNIPPVLLLIFIYGIWGSAMPAVGALEIIPGVFASIRGLAIPKIVVNSDIGIISMTTVIALALLLLVFKFRQKLGSDQLGNLRKIWIIVGMAVIAWLVAQWLSGTSFKIDIPKVIGQDLSGGAQLSPEFSTVFIGLTLYTTAFNAEIIRSGIESVPRGQWEAAQSIGMTRAQSLRMVIIPQMLRVVVPPMGNQYINTIKNSTLAIIVGYSDFMSVMGTIISRTSHAIEGTVIIILVYIVINFVLSWFINSFNNYIAIKGR